MKASGQRSGYGWDTSQENAGEAVAAGNRAWRAVLVWGRQGGEQKGKREPWKTLCENAGGNWHRKDREDVASGAGEE